MRYRFAHFMPEVFADLQHGVNALLHRAGDAGDAPAGSTLVVAPGDEVETKTGYPHPHLELLDDATSEAAALLANVQKSDIVTELADALRAEHSADEAGRHEAPADVAPAEVEQSAEVETPAAPVAPVVVDETPAAPAAVAAAPAPVAPAPAAPAAPAPAAAPVTPAPAAPAAG